MFRKNQLGSLVILLVIVTSLGSCGGVKMSGAKKASKHFESFYVGENGIQYFIKPIEFQCKESKDLLEVDIVFRINDNPQDSAVLNVSVFTENVIDRKSNLKLYFKGEGNDIEFEETFFQERESKFVHTRLSYKALRQLSYDFIQNPIDSIGVISGEEIIIFEPTRKTRKIIGYISDKLIF